MENKFYTVEEVEELLLKERENTISSILSRCNCSNLDQLYSLAKIGSYTNKGKSILGLSDNHSFDDDAYLNPLSKEAKNLVLNHKPNIYHSIMSILHSSRTFKNTDADAEVFYNFYINNYGDERPYLLEHSKELKEIISLCIKNTARKRRRFMKE